MVPSLKLPEKCDPTPERRENPKHFRGVFPTVRMMRRCL